MNFFFFLSLLFCKSWNIKVDPIKSCFFLILPMIFSKSFKSFFSNGGNSYFVCLSFLSGVFEILENFSSLSNFFLKSSYFFFFLVFFLTFFLYEYFFDIFFMKNVSMMCFYYYISMMVIFFLVFFLLFYISFMSFFLSFSGALRSL
uniref:NADH dehydrogenase subunit 6 n=1 Tax=Dictyocaulus viviparus TaxID=29172 RepID=K7QMX1_DICVI|nr:NADH dehydrogenase subunit 6 [Dictyocaulus viviparus]AFV32107.1 NADH dehydrogenase subunit 6 [Dictyocaulus viviparus]